MFRGRGGCRTRLGASYAKPVIASGTVAPPWITADSAAVILTDIVGAQTLRPTAQPTRPPALRQ